MLGLVLIVFVVIIPSLMLFLLNRQAKKYEDISGSKWMLITVMIWGFLWVGEQALMRYGKDSMSSDMKLGIFFLTLFLCLIAYIAVYVRLGHHGKLRQLNRRVDEIGEKD